MRSVAKTSRWALALMALVALSVLAAGCGGDDEGGDGDGAAAEEISTDVGVTSEPCPGSANQDRGCIYLGTLSDLTVGPFAALAVPITEGQAAFWERVNEGEGIGGLYDVNVERYTRDNEYNPEVHVARFREIEPDILALAQTLGTPTTLAAVDLYKDAEILGAPASWWSGWAFEDVILESGYNYCIESMNGLDWAAEEYGELDTVMAVHYPGDYGGDSAAGVRLWAEANGVEFQERHNVQTLPNAQAGNQDAVVSAIIQLQPDAVMIATGPAEMAEIVGKAAAQGFEGRFIGSVPTYNPAVLESAAGPAIESLYTFVSPWGPWGSDSAAHEAMQEARGGEPPANDGFTFGWIWSYPIKALLEQAVENGDLTRAGLLAAVEDVTVDYEGALPEREYAGDPNETVVREALIAQPDANAPLGSSVLRDFLVGPTAEEFEFSDPCSTPS